MLHGKRITLIVSGGIAAFKSCEAARLLMKAGAEVRTVLTEHAAEFVTPLTFEALTGHPSLTTEWAKNPESVMPHIDLARTSDLIIVMPATANLIAKAAHGIADDLASTLLVARRSPVVFVPAMNQAMWANAATQRNVETLRADGAVFLGPVAGLQACGDKGAGRMMEPAEVAELAAGVFEKKSLAGKRVLITAGPTNEAIDPIRCITNRSSGRQGFALARAARDAGAEVTLVAGPVSLTTPPQVRRIDVFSARDMDSAVQTELDHQPYDIFIGVAAVADWRPGAVSERKLKKDLTGRAALSDLIWVENPDVLARVGARPNAPLTIGFAAETATGEALTAFAREKCIRKRAAYIVANDAREALSSADNAIRVVSPTDERVFGPASKLDCARFIIDCAADALKRRETAGN
ncbi:bifunctional phosphopantothenoylcysteine decarboxylase/phosphopantothenate--cysteine ligase CoaBC [Sutterella sp.]|uniref:bifunctional phosphopantothenoylcysteine decarboxylase/phosphopantothenate--cysteine ligase CoaBC n=1 Tax=Sutterella sp. TaxID=1981025 RepID=UPI0026DFAC66|nr:bifunctional phosphopantothenoylcysteine decarboxylase/phosphopantothenate--cysteine ligase CoaBC [Sutterella sp.]MDO5532853.1 bifunctional phosphopantothenoylcysteine decarboxylase/phosphopantothenate--cysteine ligase CoaBC [Sutterella sp.]